ncbi:class I adenylate-forming enzyme family protein [Brevibacterium salitolerans]|uniref:Acyl-CoA synthetase n=1 Tax=Brevibacterium salitolerans TaxID=1403566 RepID=A0ABP5I5Y1_9MICO
MPETPERSTAEHAAAGTHAPSAVHRSAGAAPTEHTFAELWAATVAARPDAPFLLFPDPVPSSTEQAASSPPAAGSEHAAASPPAADPEPLRPPAQWTYREFDAVVRGTEGVLRAHGVAPGDAVHVCLRNCPGFVAVWLAAARMGAWIVPVDPESSSRDIADHLARISPVLGICAEARASVYRERADDSPMAVLELTETSRDLAPGGLLHPASAASTLSAAAPVTAASPAAAASSAESTEAPLPPTPEDRLAIMFTSGSTSRPKGVELTQANYAQVGPAMASAAHLGPQDRWFVSLPLFHANAQYYCFASAIAAGASVALAPRFSASRWAEQCRDLEATHASLFAAPARMILARTPPETAPLALRHVWFAQPLSTAHYEGLSRLAGCAPRQLYGMTETVAAVTCDAADPPRPETIGRPLPGRLIVLLDPVTHAEAPAGEPGVIAVDGEPGVDLFAGYLDDPETTARTFTRDEHGRRLFLTGDLAVCEPDGRLRFIGRTDDVIKVAGENVSLSEVETAAAEAPGVSEVAVIAVPDEIRDTVPEAHFVPEVPDAPPSEAQLHAWAERNLAPAARPRAWHRIDALPRTSVGKIRRFLVGRSEPA